MPAAIVFEKKVVDNAFVTESVAMDLRVTVKAQELQVKNKR